MATVELRRGDAVDVPHWPRQVGLAVLVHQVVVVAHQAASQHLGVDPVHCLGDHRQMTLAIFVVAVNRLTPVAARGDVVDSVGKFNVQGAGQGVTLKGEVGNWQDLTLASGRGTASGARQWVAASSGPTVSIPRKSGGPYPGDAEVACA